jgi:Tol biopolymer transport system component
MKRCLCTLLIFVLILSGCQEQPKILLKEFSKIVFLSDRDAPKRQFDIFIMNPDGSNQINLTPDLQSITTLSKPVLSPDGNTILFLAFERKKSLQILNIANRKVNNLTEVNYMAPQAFFSPGGNKILFVRSIDGRKQIFTINTDGSGENNLSIPQHDESNPAFSADGSRIIFISKQSGNYVLIMMNADGTLRKELIQQKGKIRYPVFSPDGEFVAFVAYQENNPGLYIMNSDGNDVRNIVNHNVIESKLQFTPDASKIVFASRSRGRKNSDICIIDIDGDKPKNLTGELNVINQHPSITPDGKSIIFHSIKFNNCEIYKVDIDGSTPVNLTDHPKWDQYPSL